MHERTNIHLSRADRSKLEAVVGNRNSPQKHVWRAKIVLLTAKGRGTAEIMQVTGKAKTVIWRWQERFRDEGTTGLWRDKTRRSRIPQLSPEVAKRVVALTLAGPPPAASHWTGSAMAKAAGISVSSVQRIWRAHGLQPHRVRQFKLSNDPQFAAKLHEIVGLYIDPPDHAIVLSVDEKSQIQALDRTQPGLPMKKGRAGTITHDYKRHGVTTLFAALNVVEGKVIGQCMKRHRHQEFIRFLNVIEASVPKKKTIHVIVDNYATHKHPEVFEWLSKNIDGLSSTSPRHPPPGSTLSKASLPISQRSVSSAASSDPCENSKMPSTASSTTPMQTQNPSSGPRTLTRSSPPSDEGTKC
jgi:transposase